MFRIGEFSQIARVTIDTLRHYDAMGLLPPARVDAFTGYRYYEARQLKTLNRILALKEIGFSLEEIARILRESPSLEELQGMLKAQLVLAEREIQAATTRQEHIINRLHQIELEDNMSEYEVILKPFEPQTVAAIREIIPTLMEMPRRTGEMFNRIGMWMQSNRLATGPAMTIYYNEGFVQENIDTECAMVLADPTQAARLSPDQPIAVRRLEGDFQVASTIDTSDFYRKPGGLTPAYQALARWIDGNGYQIVGPAREIYYGSPQTGDFTAEVQFPVEKAS